MKKQFIFPILLVTAILILACSKKNDDAAESINSFTNVTLGNEFNTQKGCFVNLKTGTVYSLKSSPKGSENQSNVDLVFWYVSAHPAMPILGAPSMTTPTGLGAGEAYNYSPDGTKFWTKLNNTNFDFSAYVPVGKFNEVKNFNDLKQAWESGGSLNEHGAEDVKSDAVYRFKTWDNKIGMIYVRSIVGTVSSPATIVFDIKVQK